MPFRDLVCRSRKLYDLGRALNGKSERFDWRFSCVRRTYSYSCTSQNQQQNWKVYMFVALIENGYSSNISDSFYGVSLWWSLSNCRAQTAPLWSSDGGTIRSFDMVLKIDE